jgi:AcrR family transcriptional regulator
MGNDSDASRHSIILAVWGLIARCGIEGVTFRRVAEQAQVSVGRIQHHYKTREALVRAACVEMVEFAHAQYEQLPDDPPTRLRHILQHAIPDSPPARFGASVWYAYLAKSVDDVEIGRLLADTKRGTEDECIRLIELAGAPAHDSDDARSAARRLLALADGLTVRVLVGDLSGSAARELLDSELAGLGSVGSENPLRPSPRPGTARAG